MISASWLVPSAHTARSKTPAAGSSRERAAITAASVKTSTPVRQSRARTDPGSGDAQRPVTGAVIVNLQAQRAVPVQQACSTVSTSSRPPRRGRSTTVWLN